MLKTEEKTKKYVKNLGKKLALGKNLPKTEFTENRNREPKTENRKPKKKLKLKKKKSALTKKNDFWVY